LRSHHIYVALTQLEKQERATKAIQSLCERADSRADEIENRLQIGTCQLYRTYNRSLNTATVLKELAESQNARLRVEKNYAELLLQVNNCAYVTIVVGPNFSAR
jgi:hypothetical protein